MTNSNYKEGSLRVRVDPTGMQRLCFPDGTFVPYEIESVCRQNMAQARKGRCRYSALFFIKSEALPNGLDIRYEIIRDKLRPVIHFNGKNIAVHSIRLSPEHLDKQQTAIIEVTAYLDRSA